jgi:replicative DNA helicase
VLDKAMTGGLQPGALFVLAARPAIGKTALALNMAANIALYGGDGRYPVGIFSLEMSSLQLVMRLLSAQSRVNINRWAYTDDHPTGEIQMVQEAAKFLGNSNIYIDDTGGIDIMELRSKARRMHERHGIKVLFIDYLQLISINSGRNSSRENDVARISGSLKALAKELNIPVVVLAQVNRAAEQSGEAPKLSNLRESGAIEQDADVVALLHRNREDQFGEKGDGKEGLKSELIIAKNRSGRTCKQHLVFFPQFTRFDPAADEVADEDIPKD